MDIKKWIPSLRIALPSVLIGLMVIAAGIYLQSKRMEHKNRAIRIPGIVVDLDYIDSSEGFSIAPIIQFRSPQGKLIYFKSSVAMFPSGYSPGDNVMVLFDPISRKPMIDSPFVVYAPIILCSLLGGFFVLFGLSPYILATLIIKKKINIEKILEKQSNKVNPADVTRASRGFRR
ncbi:MAG: DUF3592 domain-containing protein [Smithella sp.]|jgi:hypothetical protein|nr:DUF3592 domain-containing protein [Smithella sp.]